MSASRDDLIAAAFALHSAPASMALLIGAGVSRSVGMPTAWDLKQDLISKLWAVQNGDEQVEDLDAWFAKERKLAASYGNLLAALAPSAPMRRQLLSPYFEPSADEREQGIKVPGEAHRAIAKLVAEGSIRVILTLNFDPLLEQAIREAGIEPYVLSTPGAIAGRLSLNARPCVVIHLHGDYLSAELLNTTEELGQYPPEIDKLLDVVLSEHGLLIAGWSSEYDEALRESILRSATRRHPAYWIEPATLSERAKELANLRGITVIQATAEDFSPSCSRR